VSLEIRHLRLIEAIAEEGNVTKAGGRLFLTQSALSHQLRDAEEKLGTPLFVRLNKRMILTPAGQRVLDSARLILEELRRAEREVKEISSTREGVMRICTECYTCYHWLPSLLRSFNERHPRIEVQINVEATRQPVKSLVDGQLDLAVVSTPYRHSKVTLKPLFQDELLAVVKPGHPLASRRHAVAEDFAGENLLVYQELEGGFFYEQVLRPAGVRPKRTSQVQLTEAAVELVKAGLGVSVLARWAVAPYITSGELRAVPITKKGLRRRWYAAVLKSKETPPHLLDFIKLLVSGTPTAVESVGSLTTRHVA
jgi:LysR family transcriptional regulator, regulator for metE and metH